MQLYAFSVLVPLLHVLWQIRPRDDVASQMGDSDGITIFCEGQPDLDLPKPLKSSAAYLTCHQAALVGLPAAGSIKAQLE